MNVAFTPLAIDSLKGLSRSEQSEVLQQLYLFEGGDTSKVKKLNGESNAGLYEIRISENLRLLTLIAGTQALIIDSLERGTKLFKGVRDTIIENAKENELFELKARQAQPQNIEVTEPDLAERLKERLVPDNAVDSWKVIKIIATIILMSAGGGLLSQF